MNILIAGGSGLIGNGLTHALLEDRHQVWVLTRNPQTVKLPAGAVPVGWDGSTGQGWLDLLEQSDAVINLAGENIGDLPWTDARKASIRASRVKVGRVISEAIKAARRKPAVLLQASAIGWYGTHQDEILTETSLPGKDFLASVGADWEASTQAVEALGVRRVILRTGIVLTRAGGVLPKLRLPVQWGIGGPLGSGKQWLSWIHLQDEVDAIRFLLSHEQASGPVNLTAPNPVRNADMVRTLAEVLRRPYWLPVPDFALRILLGEMATLVLDGQRVVPERLLHWGYVFHYTQARAALENLG